MSEKFTHSEDSTKNESDSHYFADRKLCTFLKSVEGQTMMSMDQTEFAYSPRKDKYLASLSSDDRKIIYDKAELDNNEARSMENWIHSYYSGLQKILTFLESPEGLHIPFNDSQLPGVQHMEGHDRVMLIKFLASLESDDRKIFFEKAGLDDIEIQFLENEVKGKTDFEVRLEDFTEPPLF